MPALLLMRLGSRSHVFALGQHDALMSLPHIGAIVLWMNHLSSNIFILFYHPKFPIVVCRSQCDAWAAPYNFTAFF
jgi:hypothetical protein